MSSENEVERVDARLAELFPPGGEPDGGAEDRVVRAVTGAFARPRGRVIVRRIAAAAVLLGIGLVCGYLLRGGGSVMDELLPTALADHERTVFDAVRESLGEELSWIASGGGEVLVGLSDSPISRPLRVVFVETRNGEGALLARIRVVLPEGEPVRVALPDRPTLELAADRVGGGDVVRLDVSFADGARVASPGARVEPGRRTLVGTVRTDGETVSVYVAAF